MSHRNPSTLEAFLLILPGLTKILAVIGAIAIGISTLPYVYGTSNLMADYQFEPGLVRSNNYSNGKQDSNVTVVEFLDFQCPGCGAMHPIVKQISEEYKNEVRFVYKMYPLPIHANAEIAAQGALAAGKQGKFFEYVDKLFAYQDNPGLSQRTQERIATELNLNMDQWNKDRVSDEIAKQVAYDKEDGRRAVLPVSAGSTQTSNVDSTPTFVMIKDGKIQYKTNGMSADEFRTKLDDLLGKQPSSVQTEPTTEESK